MQKGFVGDRGQRALSNLIQSFDVNGTVANWRKETAHVAEKKVFRNVSFLGQSTPSQPQQCSNALEMLAGFVNSFVQVIASLKLSDSTFNLLHCDTPQRIRGSFFRN